MSRASQQRIISLALDVLDTAAYRSSTHRIDNAEVALALSVLWLFVADREPLTAFWDRGKLGVTHPWESCREHYYGIAHALRNEGWDAPPHPIRSE